MKSITRNAYAKINLGLDVTGVLPNGYHEVKMIMQNVGICDTLTFTEREDDQIVIETDDGNLPVNEDNLIYKAVMLLRGLTGDERGVTVHLTKRIPVAAGMAGGSTDAAATLLGVNELWNLGLSKEKIQEESVSIGADVPYCVLGQTALSEGIGEKLTPVASPPQAYLVVAKPDIYVSTPVVYKKLDAKENYEHPDIDGMICALEEKDLDGIVERLGNVLETVTVEDYPIVDEIKKLLLGNGAMGALMSGSGPSVFGIFRDEQTAKDAYEKLSRTNLAKQLFVTTFQNGENV
nr:4-(cytidine 5'-diphospho)-2-C-methyl-D-erythritol kinase [Lachnospiraceae bacterium]